MLLVNVSVTEDEVEIVFVLVVDFERVPDIVPVSVWLTVLDIVLDFDGVGVFDIVGVIVVVGVLDAVSVFVIV